MPPSIIPSKYVLILYPNSLQFKVIGKKTRTSKRQFPRVHPLKYLTQNCPPLKALVLPYAHLNQETQYNHLKIISLIQEFHHNTHKPKLIYSYKNQKNLYNIHIPSYKR